MQTCYCCSELRVSDEHVPPKCVFPHKKYLPSGMGDLRKNLLTVPSCNEHNSAKSTDDEYFGCFLAMVAHNDLAELLFVKKWLRSQKRTNYSLISKMLENSRQVTLDNGQTTIALNVDMPRIENVIFNMTKGLYYYETSEKLIGGNWFVRSPNFLHENLSYPEDLPDLVRMRNAFVRLDKVKFPGIELRGANKDAFYYQRLFNGNSKIFRFVFYFAIEFYCFNLPDQV